MRQLAFDSGINDRSSHLTLTTEPCRAMHPAARGHGLTFPEVKTSAHPDTSRGREVFRNSCFLRLATER